MKKLIALLLSASLFLMITGCSKSKGVNISKDDMSAILSETTDNQSGTQENTGDTFIETDETSGDTEISEEKSETNIEYETGSDESNDTGTVSEEATKAEETTETGKPASNIFTLTSWANIYYAGEGKGWQKGPDHLKTSQDDSSGGTNTYVWNLGEYSTELDFIYTDNQDQAAVSECYYTAAWTLPETIAPGETLKVPVTFSGYSKNTYYIDTDKYTDELPFNLTSFAFAETYFGKSAGEGKSTNWLTFATNYYITGADGDDDAGYAEIDILDWPSSYTVLEIYVINKCMGMEIGKVYYYER